MQPYSFFPASYGNAAYSGNPYQVQQYQQQAAMMQNQNSGNIVRVPSEAVARDYPVALGNSVTFINEAEPYCYTKTAGNSPLEAAVFKRYRLVEEVPQDAQNTAQTTPTESNIDLSEYALKADLTAISTNYEALKAEFEKLKASIGKMQNVKPKAALNNFEYEGIDDP